MHHVYFIIQLDRIEFGRIYLLLHHQGFREWSRLGIFGGPVATPQVIGVLHWIFFLKLSGDWGVLVEYPLFCHKFVCFTKVPSQTHIYIYIYVQHVISNIHIYIYTYIIILYIYIYIHVLKIFCPFLRYVSYNERYRIQHHFWTPILEVRFHVDEGPRMGAYWGWGCVVHV